MVRGIVLFVFVFFAYVNAKGQSHILERTLANFDTIHNLSYSVNVIAKAVFGEDIDTTHRQVLISSVGQQYAYKITDADSEKWFDGNKLVYFNLMDSTYTISNNTDIPRYELLSDAVQRLKRGVERGVPIEQKSDSTIAGTAYYHLKIVERDSIVNDTQTFDYVTLLIDKETYLPYFYRMDAQGFIKGTDILINFFNEYYFTDYELNSKDFAILSPMEIPVHFSMEKPKEPLPLLAKGTKAPEIELYDLDGHIFTLEAQKGKVVLLNFTLTGCPACIMSTEVLNALYAEYGNDNLIIVTMHPADGGKEEFIQQEITKYNVQYPKYLNPENGRLNAEKYHVTGYPTFYLIDKEGNISDSFSGYYPKLGDDLRNRIDALNSVSHVSVSSSN